MSQFEINLPSLQSSYMWSEKDVPQVQSYINNNLPTSTLSLETTNSNKSQAPRNTISLYGMIDPRFDQLLNHRSSKIAPYRNDVDSQKISEQATETPVAHLQLSPNASANTINKTAYPTTSPRAKKSTKATFISKTTKRVRRIWNEPYDRLRACAYMAICVLSIAIIVVPLALLLSLSNEHTTTIGTTTAAFISTIATTTTIPVLGTITQAGDPTVGVYITSPGGSTGGSNGVYLSASETPAAAIDGLLSTKYLNYGLNGSIGSIRPQQGVHTGFYVTPAISSHSVACALLFATGNDSPTRDPLNVTLEGTNAVGAGVLDLGSSWTLIYSGPTGINATNTPGRSVYGIQQNFSNNIAYSSYRLLVTAQRANSDAVQYAEARIIGYI